MATAHATLHVTNGHHYAKENKTAITFMRQIMSNLEPKWT